MILRNYLFPDWVSKGDENILGSEKVYEANMKFINSALDTANVNMKLSIELQKANQYLERLRKEFMQKKELLQESQVSEEELYEEIDELNEKVKELEAQRINFGDEIDELENEVEKLSEENEELKEQQKYVNRNIDKNNERKLFLEIEKREERCSWLYKFNKELIDHISSSLSIIEDSINVQSVKRSKYYAQYLAIVKNEFDKMKQFINNYDN